MAADSAYGDQDGFRSELAEGGLPFVMAIKRRRGMLLAATGPMRTPRTPLIALRGNA